MSTAFGWVLELLSLGLLWLTALALIALGAYLALFMALRPLRQVGVLLLGIGLLLAAYAYGKGDGAADCEARWKEANHQAELARKNLEAEVDRKAAEIAKRAAKEIEAHNVKARSEIADARREAAQLATAAARCRRATDADNRRLCRITRYTAPGCENYR